MGPAAVIAAIALVVIFLGVRVARRGWRGRQVGDHLFCRLCGFDLSGRDLAGRCPECGADLEARRDVTVGVRHRRWALLAAGAAIFCLGSIPLWFVISGQLRAVDWQQHKPVFWLVHEAKVSGPVDQAAALAELTRRMKAGTITPERVSTIVD